MFNGHKKDEKQRKRKKIYVYVNCKERYKLLKICLKAGGLS